MNRFLLLIAVLCLILAGCGGSVGSVGAISISPRAASVQPNDTAQFTLDQTVLVDWSAPDGGTVVNGLFTAPNIPGAYRVVATGFLNPLVSATSTVTVADVKVTVNPSLITVAKGTVNANAFTATIAGSANKSVTWSIDGSGGGTIASSTPDGSGNARANYTAGTLGGFFSVRATSAADPTVSGTALVMVLGSSSVGLNPLSVTISTTSPNNAIVLTAVVTDSTGAIDTTSALTWDITLNPVGGSLSGSGSRSRTFTAPTNFLGTGTCQVRARTAQGVAAIATIQVVSG